ncbi:peptidoglycan DD-metalloendopeptidase family protein [Marinobacter salinexigens]|uniref:Peptidoglycan DD-metalloendopeptidase family protein n=1 Tax=Marinobacter salinexigens TaxID=2919747 RepID=A0A5B0V9F4_9GAMM|nr:peptidoglycan DD-metalloendopeptidase family protein [Marinobacter salinexigens]KAA1170681.1 peptidoglycan DD-metalloendopeptidase family protein [Marinobacter salinexigens]
MFKMFPKTHITIAAAATVVVTAAILMSPSADVEAKRMSYSLDLEQGAVTEKAATESATSDATRLPTDDGLAKTDNESGIKATETLSSPAEPELHWQSFDIKSGDTLSSLFNKAGFNDRIMLSVIHGEGEADTLQNLYAGETIRFAANDDGNLEAVELKRNRLESLKIEKTADGFKGETALRTPEARPAFATGTIDGSLYLAARDAGLDDRLTMELAGIFGWSIDFVYDVRKGDHFEVVYEELYLDGERFDTGKILSARFTNRDEDYVALLYTDSNGDSDYYSPDGKSMRKAFLRTPINARVSSPFNLQRRHPILNVVRPHEGTDYGAPTGTPIKAAGDGRVLSAGNKGGYGRAVVLQHGDNITTLYAHMSRLGKGIKRGTRVKQGQTIGYVGSSGMATGPHLHYEFRVNGSPRNSRKVQLPDAKPVPASEMASFKAATKQQLAQFDAFRENYQQLALATDD